MKQPSLMEDKSWELFTEEERKFFEAFHNAKTLEEIEELEKRMNKLYESRENNDIPHYDMTLEEFRAKYHTKPLEDVFAKYGL